MKVYTATVFSHSGDGTSPSTFAGVSAARAAYKAKAYVAKWFTEELGLSVDEILALSVEDLNEKLGEAKENGNACIELSIKEEEHDL